MPPLIELDDGKIYRKALYLIVKPWFPVDFPLNQSSEPRICGRITRTDRISPPFSEAWEALETARPEG